MKVIRSTLLISSTSIMSRLYALFALCVVVQCAKLPAVRHPEVAQVQVPVYRGHVSVYQGQQVPTAQGQVSVSQGQVPVVPGYDPTYHNQLPVYQGQQKPSIVHNHHQHVQHVSHAVTDRPNVAIIHQDTQVNPDGSYHNVWESENGIKVQEEASVHAFAKNAVAHTVTGTVSYTDNDGTPFVLTYTADENGFHPQGKHLPVPPPLPPAIARALEYIAAHPYVEKDVNVAHHQRGDFPIVESN